MRVFISYAREDIAVAKKLYQDLKSAGVKPWMDEYDLLVGQNWKLAITRAIEKSDFFLALLSSNSLSKRGYVQKELRRAMTALEEMPPTDIFLLPARLDNCKPEDDRLKDLNWADLFPDYNAGLTKLKRVFEYKKRNDEKVATPVTEDPVVEKVATPAPEVPKPRYELRKEPVTVSGAEFRKVFRLNDDQRPLEYVENDYQDNGDGTVTDRATGLTWQKSGSTDRLTYKKAEAYIQGLNQGEGFAGYKGWRLPTVDELASLLEAEEKNGDLYIDPIFDKNQRWCWTSDQRASGGAWGVSFSFGGVGWAS